MNKERVNIQYSIDLNELAGEVVRLLNRASKSATTAATVDFENLKNMDEKSSLSLNTLTSIDLARKRLAAIDYALNDVSQIVNGYLAFKVQDSLNQQADQNPLQPPQTPLDVGDVREGASFVDEAE